MESHFLMLSFLYLDCVYSLANYFLINVILFQDVFYIKQKHNIRKRIRGRAWKKEKENIYHNKTADKAINLLFTKFAVQQQKACGACFWAGYLLVLDWDLAHLLLLFMWLRYITWYCHYCSFWYEITISLNGVLFSYLKHLKIHLHF